MISAVCVTYGRVRWLEHTIADFLNQEWSCPWELLIVNTFPKQTLTGIFPNVRIINLPQRHDSLGHARNIAVAAAAYPRIVIADDDDQYLPHFLRTFDENWSPGLDWIWLDKRLCAYGEDIKEVSFGCHGGCFGFTKHAWESVGAYPSLTVGEDRSLVGKITKQFNGRKVMLGDTAPPFICRMDNGAYHISGMGDDKPGDIPAHDRIAADLSRRVAAGQEKTGKIVLNPNRPIDWKTKSRDFMDAQSKKNSMNDVCLVELGRYGDIINILPIAHHIAKTHSKIPALMVSQEFASLLDGVSYVTPYPVKLPFNAITQAMQIARDKFPVAVQCQIWGNGYSPKKLTSNFNSESWRMAGYLNHFYDTDWKLVFDRRDIDRESAIASKVFSSTMPKVVTNLTGAVSAPLPEARQILFYLRDRLNGKFDVVDIGELRLPNIYDILGLIDRAKLLVTIDTATLHIAGASSTPMIAMVRDGWDGAQPRYGCADLFRYSDVRHDFKRVVSAVERHLCK